MKCGEFSDQLRKNSVCTQLATNRCAVGQPCNNKPASRNKQAAQVSAVKSQRREVSATLTLCSSVGTLTDVSVNTSFSDTKSKAAKIIKRSNKFRNRNELRKEQQCCQRKVVEAFKWYKRGIDTWWKEINRDNKKICEEWHRTESE